MAQQLTENLAVLSNPQSGANSRGALNKLDALTKQHNIRHLLARNPIEVETALHQLAKAPPDVLAISAGDGTVDLAVTLIRTQHIFTQEPKLALLCGGTTNMIHRDIGWRGTPHRALAQILSNAPSRAIKCCPLEITKEDATTFHGFFLGTGAIPRAILEVRKTLHHRNFAGPLSETLSAGTILWRLKMTRDLSKDKTLHPEHISWHADGVDRQDDHIFTAFTSLNRLILGLRPPASLKENAVAILQMSDDRKLNWHSAEHITLDMKSPWILDGEIHKPGGLDIMRGNPLTFLAEPGR